MNLLFINRMRGLYRCISKAIYISINNDGFSTANEIGNSSFETPSKTSSANPASSHSRIEQKCKNLSYFSRITNVFCRFYFRDYFSVVVKIFEVFWIV